MQRDFKKICLIGAESTGKSTLALALSQELRSRGYWAQTLSESLRLFCARAARLPTVHDQNSIFHAQVLAEDEAEQSWRSRSPQRDGWLFCDSSPLVTAFYSRWFFANDDLLPAALAHQKTYAHCLLTEPVLPWEADGFQRDGPLARARIDSDLRRFLQQQNVAFEPVTPVYDAVARAGPAATQLAGRLHAMTAGI